MACVAVTRGGAGDFWLFSNLEEADEHALVQYGDAICTGPGDLLNVWRQSEIPDLCRRVGDERLCLEIQGVESLKLQTPLLERLWSALVGRASRPPEPAAVLEQVAQDRRATRAKGVTHRRHPTEKEALMAEAETRPIARTAKHSVTSVITFGKDAEGKNYGPDNNPKRANSAAHARFALYKSGQTIQQALDAGVTRGDINWDSKQGFIVLK